MALSTVGAAVLSYMAFFVGRSLWGRVVAVGLVACMLVLWAYFIAERLRARGPGD